MKILKTAVITTMALLMLACKHPIEIVGQGDVLTATGTRNCYLENFQARQKNCTENAIQGAYLETYYASPRAGWKFLRWENYCTDGASGAACTVSLPANIVNEFQGAELPPLVAVFTPISGTQSDITLSWSTPNQRENGAHLPKGQIKGYEVGYAAIASGLSAPKAVNNNSATSYRFKQLPPDIYAFYVVTIDTNNLKSAPQFTAAIDLR